MTLLEILETLGPEACAEGNRLEVQTGDGRMFTIEFGERIPADTARLTIC